jgi:hypothetical protein
MIINATFEKLLTVSAVITLIIDFSKRVISLLQNFTFMCLVGLIFRNGKITTIILLSQN